MDIFRRAPVSIAIATAIALTGCFGGGGGGGSSSGGSDGGSGGGGTNPPDNNLTSYNLTIQTPQQQVTFSPTSRSERVLTAVMNTLITPAFAQVVIDPRPEDFRAVIINGDDNGTPDDVTDDEDRILLGGEDFDVTSDGGRYRLELPFEPQVNSYIGVEVSPGMEFTVLTHDQSLIADPVSTFITRVISSYAAQLDQLDLEELDELIEEIQQLAADPAVQQALSQAYLQATDTEELLAGVAAQLASTIEHKVEEAVTPPLPASSASQAIGSYHFMGLSIGAFSSPQGGGLLLGGHNNDARLTVDGSAATLSPQGAVLEFEAVHPVGGSAVVTAELLEDEPATITIDSRGLLNAESESVARYEKDSNDVEACETPTADCTDRDYSSALRMLAAGPADARFNTLIGASYNDRHVTNADGDTELQVVAGFLDLGIRKPTSPIRLQGAYGTLEYGIQVEAEDPDVVDFEAWLVDMHYQTSTVRYCETANVDLEVYTNDLTHQYERMEPADGDCLYGSAERQFILEEDGELTILQPDGPHIEGWVSADGLTILMAAQDPDQDDMADYAQVNEGERAALISVKLDEELKSLAGRRYSLFSLALDARAVRGEGMAGMNRFLAGTLEFDAEGKAQVQASSQGQFARLDGLGAGFNNLQQSFAIPASSINLDDGHLTVSTTIPGEGSATSTLKLDGYVQEGGRVLLLNRTLTHSGGALFGPTIAVCTNCD